MWWVVAEELGGAVVEVHVHQGHKHREAGLAVVLVEDLVARVGKAEEQLEVAALDSRQVRLNKGESGLLHLCQHTLVLLREGLQVKPTQGRLPETGFFEQLTARPCCDSFFKAHQGFGHLTGR